VEAQVLLNTAKRKGCSSPYHQQLVQHPCASQSSERLCVFELSVRQGDSTCPDLVCWGLGFVEELG